MSEARRARGRRVCLPLDFAERLLANVESIHRQSREIMDGVGSSSNIAYSLVWTARGAHASLEPYVVRARRRAAQDRRQE
jgi:hypothetical protein